MCHICVCKRKEVSEKSEENRVKKVQNRSGACRIFTCRTCNYSACPARLFLCLLRRFINRTSRGRPDGCYDTVISFHGSLSSSWALVCCLLAACWSFPCNTHSSKGEVFSPDMQMVFRYPLNYQQLGPPLPQSFSRCLNKCVCGDLNMWGQLSFLLFYTIGLEC